MNHFSFEGTCIINGDFPLNLSKYFFEMLFHCILFFFTVLLVLTLTALLLIFIFFIHFTQSFFFSFC